jgi:predicted NBD/HSP70 family sugar kinase
LFLDNPLKALAIAEVWSQSERSKQDFVVVNLGTGVGIGFALGGRIHRGRTNSAGEWGHSVLVADGRVCRCGARGCVEAYVGAPGIVQTLRETYPTSSLAHPDDQTATIVAIGQAAREGDQEALDVIGQTGRYLGLALGSLVNILNPDVVIIGGWVAWEIGAELLEAASDHVRRQALGVPMLAAEIEIQSPRHNRVSLGVAALAFEGHVKAALGNPDAMSAGTQDAPTVTH